MTPTRTSLEPLRPFDLAKVADNGLRRGFTTGTSAAAATKAALTYLLTGELPKTVDVTLPDGCHFLPVEISPVQQCVGWTAASVVKDGGDDPDQTHGARIIAKVRRNEFGEIVFLRGDGVGVVTQSGLRLEMGEPAINATPRAMIRQAISEVFASDSDTFGLDVEIGCENGAAIAARTFNPRLGIVGGISILGTTGIVEPKSLASFKASIEVYIRVALGDCPSQIVLSPGNLGQRFARASLHLPIKEIVQVSNFVGFALDTLSQTLRESSQSLDILWIIGHPGKLAKLLMNEWDTHSSRGTSGVSGLVSVALDRFPHFAPLITSAQSTEAVIELLGNHPEGATFWKAVEDAIAKTIGARVQNVDAVRVRLFSMTGSALGGGR